MSSSTIIHLLSCSKSQNSYRSMMEYSDYLNLFPSIHFQDSHSHLAPCPGSCNIGIPFSTRGNKTGTPLASELACPCAAYPIPQELPVSSSNNNNSNAIANPIATTNTP